MHEFMMKTDEKFKLLRELIEKNEQMIEKIISEMQNMRKMYLKFKGIESLEKIYDEIKKNIGILKKLEASTKANSEKTIQIFREINKKYKDIDEIRRQTEENSDQLSDLRGRTEALEVAINDAVRKSEIEKIQKDLEAKLSKTEEIIKAFEELKKSFGKKGTLKKLEGVIAEEEKNQEIFRKKIEEIDILDKKILSVTDQIDKLKESIDLIDKKIDMSVTQKDLVEIKARLEKLELSSVNKTSKIEDNYKKLYSNVRELSSELKDVKKRLRSLEVFSAKDEISGLNKKIEKILKIIQNLTQI